MEETIIRPPSATALLVGAEGAVPSELGIRVFSALTLARMRIVRVGGPELACERMVTTMPQVVVTLGLLSPAQRVDLGDHAAAVGAVMVELDPTLDLGALDEILARAVEEATDRNRRKAEGHDEDESVEVSVDTVPPPPGHEPSKMEGEGDEIDDNW